jgi:transcriptional regulator with XRE-family HTH domain
MLLVSDMRSIIRGLININRAQMKAREIVAWNVRQLRVRQGMSSETLATSAGVDRSYLGRLERGLANPTIEVLERLASTLKIEIAALFVVPPPLAQHPNALPGGRPRRGG